ncbi:MMPL family transporter [Streptomyces clavuligerus]|uniref:Putative membrane protein n=10 Tax=Streptomyces clavuligerus TaxID=1901 RepID=E2Q9C4_STRCL|nr:MMPL family transporter [Streptomyces clavuligerus]ANW21331.1 transporter [Streptomyces clavuligerus]AXU15957.1 MMPL family transporter [Streptomyces clavuligerus]EFG05544.1 Putative membrane protein [Streptomyces clavuligerus]MBY6306087.1 MMPL family transporter [Streptomyces clavuligerus]QCS08737.1 MMPL family transporter [Streptomyces clavuligerus]
MHHPHATGPPSAAAPQRGLFGALARLTGRRPKALLALTLLLLAGAVVLGGGVADRLRSGGSGGVVDPGSESSFAARALEREFPGARPNLVLLAEADGSVDDTAAARQGRELTARLAAVPGITGVTSYWDGRAATLRSEDGGQALIVARINGDELAAERTLEERVIPAFDGERGALGIRIGGTVATQQEQQTFISEDLLRAELIALPITLVVLMVVFGSAVAALLPIGIGVIAILGTNAVLRVITEFTDVSVFASNLTTALGLGLAIDYALLIVRRYREELSGGKDGPAALAATLGTAGRTVLFSAATVAVSLAAMMVFPLYFLRSLAYAGISVVVLAAVAALVVLPALLALLGPRIDAWDIRRLVRRAPRAGRAPKPEGEGWARLARGVMRRAPLVATGTLAVLLLLGAPFLNVDFGTADYRQLPTSAESRVVQERIRDDFPGSPTGTVDVVAETTENTENTETTGTAVSTGAAGTGALDAYAQRLSGLPGVIRVDGPGGRYTEGKRSGPAQPARASGGIAHLAVVPSLEPISEEAKDLVRDIRELAAPFPVRVSGTTAALIDTQSAIGRGLPWAVGAIVLATLVLVFLLTGSVLVPVQAVLLNALSLTAMLGAVVWIFQDGHLSGVLGFTPTGSIETALPVLMFCLAFGLSMDYGVFLLSRIKEERERQPDHRSAVVEGIRGTGGVITAAAVVLAVVMVAIGSSRITNTKMLGLGVALAILMDAMVIRTLLVPAVLRLTGEATWWAPGPLRRLHARFGISEGAPAPAAPASPVPTGAAPPHRGPAAGEVRDEPRVTAGTGTPG